MELYQLFASTMRLSWKPATPALHITKKQYLTIYYVFFYITIDRSSSWFIKPALSYLEWE